MRKKNICLLLTFLMILSGGSLAQSQEQGSGGDDLAAKTQNPVGAMYSLPFKFSFDYGADNGEASFLNIQPVLPQTIGEWNLIHRIILPLIDTPGAVTGIPEIPNSSSKVTELPVSVISIILYIFRQQIQDKVIWGIGPSLMMDTATDDQLGSGKWSTGPTAVVLVQPKPWTLGILGRQLWSFAGDSDRNTVSQMLLEPFINYNLEGGWYLLSDMIITANWEADSGNRWTVPFGGGFGKMFAIGSQKMNTKLEAYYNVEKPDGAPDWSFSWTLQFLFPR